jgi:hypothetical protein
MLHAFAGNLGVNAKAILLSANVGEATVQLAGITALAAQAWPVEELIMQRKVTPSCSYYGIKVNTLATKVRVGVGKFHSVLFVLKPPWPGCAVLLYMLHVHVVVGLPLASMAWLHTMSATNQLQLRCSSPATADSAAQQQTALLADSHIHLFILQQTPIHLPCLLPVFAIMFLLLQLPYQKHGNSMASRLWTPILVGGVIPLAGTT